MRLTLLTGAFLLSIGASAQPAPPAAPALVPERDHPAVQRSRLVRLDGGRSRQGHQSRGTRQLHRPQRHAGEPGRTEGASAHRRPPIATTASRSNTALPARAATAVSSCTRRRLRALSAMFPQSIEVQMNHEHAGDFWCIEENIEVPDDGEAAAAEGGSEVRRQRGRRAPDPQSHGRFGKAAGRVEHHGRSKPAAAR